MLISILYLINCQIPVSNIYAKPITNGNSTYTLSEEERQAIDKAIYSQNIYKMKE